MTEKEFQDKLVELIELYNEDVFGDTFLEDASADTFENYGFITSNSGLVITLADGKAFELTVVER